MAAEQEAVGKKKNSGTFSRLTFRNLSLKTSSKDKKSKAPSPGKDDVDFNKNEINKRHSTAELSSWQKQSPVIGIAVQPFDAILPCDLSFTTGDHITILTRTSKQFDWWEGTINGKTGIFPANYIRVVES